MIVLSMVCAVDEINEPTPSFKPARGSSFFKVRSLSVATPAKYDPEKEAVSFFVSSNSGSAMTS